MNGELVHARIFDGSGDMDDQKDIWLIVSIYLVVWCLGG
jgi:hypothetical protein